MNESEELNKKLMATHSNINPIIPVPLSVLSLCEWTTQFEPPLPQKHKCVGTGALLDHLPSPLDAPSVPSKLTGFDRSGREEVIRFYWYACHVGGISALSTERQNLNLKNAQWPAFKFSPHSPVSPLRHPLFKLSHTRTHTESIWIVTDTHRHTPSHMVNFYACKHNCA